MIQRGLKEERNTPGFKVSKGNQFDAAAEFFCITFESHTLCTRYGSKLLISEAKPQQPCGFIPRYGNELLNFTG